MPRAIASLFLALLFAAGLCPAPEAAAAGSKPKLRQKRCARILSGPVVEVAFKKPNKPGDAIVAYAVWDGASSAELGDSNGNEYGSAVGPTFSGSDSAQIFFASGIADGRNAVTAVFDGDVESRGVLCVFEYSGLDPTDPLYAASEASGSSDPIEAGSIQATAGSLVFVAAETDGKRVRKLRPGARGRFGKYGIKIADKVLKEKDAGPYAPTASQNQGDAWVMQVAAFKPAFDTSASAKFPLRVSANGRYLVDQKKNPFLVTGDSPQALFVALSEAEAEGFMANRRAAGFNALWINLLTGPTLGGRSDASTFDGILPLTTPGDLATPNEAYFARVDRVLKAAADQGIVVFLDPAETIDFLSVLRDNGEAKARAYGRFLGSRYKSFDNIVWFNGNDFQTWQVAGDDAVVQAVARGIRDRDGRHLQTALLNFTVSSTLDDPTLKPLVELNTVYSYQPTYAKVLAEYARPNPFPIVLGEANYEGEHNWYDQGTPHILRRQAYWALLSGAAGHFYGNRYTWQFLPGWEGNVDLPGSMQMGLVKDLFEPRRWYDLVPDAAHAVVTAGYGTPIDCCALLDSDYATAARTADGDLLMAYMPTIREITVDMSKLSGPAHASWYDPANGTFTPIPGSPLSNSGVRAFSPPGDNSAGDGDWVLILETRALVPGT